MHTAAGHRQRVKDRFLKEGLDSFSEVHALELLLFYAIPQKDTKPLARELLDTFGSLQQVLTATAEELKMVKGVGDQVATFFPLINACARYCRVNAPKKDVVLNSTEKYSRYLEDFFIGRRNETVFLLCMDAKCKVLCCKKVGEGDVNSANIPIRRMVEIALGANATTVILAHNHPSGLALPSPEDRDTTERLAKALGAMDILLADHVVVADDDCVSMVQSRMYDPRQFCRLV